MGMEVLQMLRDTILPNFEPPACRKSPRKNRLVKIARKTPLFFLLLTFSIFTQVTFVQDNDTPLSILIRKEFRTNLRSEELARNIENDDILALINQIHRRYEL
jgi:hypothetical protein